MAWWRVPIRNVHPLGLYALPAGEWNGQPVAGIGEWIMDRTNIPVKDIGGSPSSSIAVQRCRVGADRGTWRKYIVIT